MNKLDNISIFSLIFSFFIVSMNFFDFPLHNKLKIILNNKKLQIILAIILVVSSYYHLPSSIICSSILFLSIGINENKDIKIAPLKNKIYSKPDESIKNNKKINTKINSNLIQDPTLLNQEDLSNLSGFTNNGFVFI